MSAPISRFVSRSLMWPLVVAAALPLAAQSTQRIDEEYTRKIRELTRDPRITTELVDHLPWSATVPSPLKFHGRIIGQPGELTYARDIHRYFEALDQASDRVRTWSIGKSEEGRDMIVLAVADEATIRDLDRYKKILADLTDPRRTSDGQARQLIADGKVIYWITSGMHSPETGGPEVLQELAYRLAVGESDYIRTIRNNVITFITPVIEVDGREKQVDTYYFNKTRERGASRLPLMYWGKYVAHDNNRDNIGQLLQLSKNVNRFFLEWHPPIMHDLHEASNYLYASTGTGPYNEAIDAITVDEWWILAKNEVMELTKRGVPGVWTYGFYDGWTPNYMFFAAHAHNATGRFYEVQSYGPDTSTVRLGATQTSREWFRPNPPLPSIAWGPRNNTNIQQSGLLITLNHVAKNRETYLENYWLKNKRQVEKGRNGPTYAWVIPADQRRKAEVASVVNDLRVQGVEFHRATAAFRAGSVSVAAGDYIIRADQPYRTIPDMYFSVQNFSPSNPRPYDDTGWTYQLMRNFRVTPVTDRAVLAAAMTPVTAEVRATGGIEGSGPVLVVEHTTDNNLARFRFRHANVPMQAAEEEFELGGRKFAAGAFIVPNADQVALGASLRELGLSAWATASAPTVRTHDLDVPRIGYIHAWQRTQDEGWVRASLEAFGIPFTYFADIKLREGNLRSKYDVIIYPHVGGNAISHLQGIAKRENDQPLPYKRTDKTPNLGALDQADDIRGGMGMEGLLELGKFVQAGGTLIVEGSTTTIFPEFGLTTGITIEEPQGLFARGSIFRGIIADKRSPIAYGYEGSQLPVYFNQGPVINAGGTGIPAEFQNFLGGGNQGPSQNITPMANRLRLSPWETDTAGAANRGGADGQPDQVAQFREMARAFGMNVDETRPRVILQFPSNPNDMLLSGTLQNGQLLAGRAQVVDAQVGQGHVVMFGIRPFWRWQTHGTYFLGFNTILNWNDLGAGRTPPPTRTTSEGQR
ncbi:MAG: M14 family zinc carboxypeptidase [Gemmatimonadota bacterium]